MRKWKVVANILSWQNVTLIPARTKEFSHLWKTSCQHHATTLCVAYISTFNPLTSILNDTYRIYIHGDIYITVNMYEYTVTLLFVLLLLLLLLLQFAVENKELSNWS